MRPGAGVTASGVCLLVAVAAAAARPGLPAHDPWSCPASHPIKGYLADSGRRIYFVPGNPFYDEASPERCYATEDEARHDGARPARDPAPAPISGELAFLNGRTHP